MKTAVEWLEWQLGAYINGNIDELTFEDFLFLVGIAKEMEKEQIVKHSVELTKILISNPFEKSGKHPKELVNNYFNKTIRISI
jgi:hypothetical protein